MPKPIILIPLAHSVEPIQSPRLFVRDVFTEAIERAGGIPLCIARPSEADLDHLITIMEGLYLIGGVDPHPKYYQEEIRPTCGETDEARDALELGLIKRALQKKLPILGTCRGLQLMNIYFGGSLYQDLGEEFPGALAHKGDEVTERKKIIHDVIIERESQLGSIIGEGTFPVNSLHHQGIKVLGGSLAASASSPDGLIEGIELPNYPFCIGTQWHPEELSDDASQKLFSAFVAACNKK